VRCLLPVEWAELEGSARLGSSSVHFAVLFLFFLNFEIHFISFFSFLFCRERIYIIYN
jgi:hypothetical protein